jgi:hypothetical protein
VGVRLARCLADVARLAERLKVRLVARAPTGDRDDVVHDETRVLRRGAAPAAAESVTLKHPSAHDEGD